MLNRAAALNDLRVPPGNWLEQLRGERVGRHSIHEQKEVSTVSDEPIMAPVHPGEILREEFLEPMGISEYRLAKAIGVPQTRISAITHGRRRISADTGLRLSRYFGMSEGFWTGLQDDSERARAKDHLGDALEAIHPIASWLRARDRSERTVLACHDRRQPAACYT